MIWAAILSPVAAQTGLDAIVRRENYPQVLVRMTCQIYLCHNN